VENPIEPVAASEPCPTPLAWQEVVSSFRAAATVRPFETEFGTVTATEFGSGRPLVFFPGLAGGPLLFSLTSWLLKEDFHSILLEHPQFSSPVSSKQLVPQTAEAFGLAIEHLCPRGAYVYAPSIGSQIALQLMASRPALIRSAFLQGAWAARQLGWIEKTLLRLGSFSGAPLRRVPLWLPAQIQNHRRWFPPFDETRFGFLLNEIGQTPIREISRRLLAAANTDLRPLLPSIVQPTVILHCEGEGRLLAAAELELEQQLACVRKEEMFHSGLHPYLTHPHRLVKLLRAWVEMADAANQTGSSVRTDPVHP
jgi:pimeloyl-ACP methyl ester carboxylesterase